MSKIGILYICTGRYSVYWNGFYNSVKKFFLPDMERFFFVWTDSEQIKKQAETDDHIICYHQELEKWPFPTLKRFSYFLRAESDLKEMDYILYMNGNLRVNVPIDARDILPYNEQQLFVTLHPGFYASSPDEYTYDNNPDCLAYIKKGEGKYYFAGGLNGGCGEAYMELISTLAGRIEQDLSKNIIALWHDESHINRYMKDLDESKYRILSPAYLYPEGWNLPFEEKITVLDKKNKGGHDFLRSEN